MCRRYALGLVLCLTAASSFGVVPDAEDLIFRRGDANNDRVVNMSDATFITSYLFLGGPAPPCMNQADANNSGLVDVSDAIYILDWLYNGGTAPPYPGANNDRCAVDDGLNPGCAVNPCP